VAAAVEWAAKQPGYLLLPPEWRPSYVGKGKGDRPGRSANQKGSSAHLVSGHPLGPGPQYETSLVTSIIHVVIPSPARPFQVPLEIGLVHSTHVGSIRAGEMGLSPC
jgi:hypothetical protein